MLNFLNPTFLFALVAAAIPLLIHLLNRHRVREVPFSTIHFLKQLEKKQMRNVRIRQILLLILRTLIIICLVLAFARPTFRGAAGVWADRSAIEAIIILDNTLSMNETHLTGSLLEDLRAAFASLEGVFRPGDRITVIQSSLPMKILLDREMFQPGLWEQVGQKIEPNALRSDLPTALEFARLRCQESDLVNQEVYLISDFQKSVTPLSRWRELADQLAQTSARYYAIALAHRNFANLSVDSVQLLNRLVEKNLPLRVQGIIHNHHPEQYQSTLVSLLLNGKRWAQENVEVAPGESKAVQFQITLPEEGFVQGALELESDALLEDNRRFFNFYVPQKIRILHITDETGGQSFLPLIIRPALKRGIFQYEQIPLGGWSGRDFFQYDVLLLEGINALPEALQSRLHIALQQGISIGIIPGEQMSPAKWNGFLQALGVGKLSERWGEPGNPQQFLTLQRLRWDHAVFEGLFSAEKPRLNPIEVYAGYRLRPAEGTQVLIELSDGSPFLAIRPQRQGQVFFLATPLNLAWSQLPLKGFVVPLLYRLLYYCGSQRVPAGKQIRVGQSFTQEFEHLAPPFEFSALDPADREIRLTPAFRGTTVSLTLPRIALPGNYRLQKAGKTIAVVSVNPWPEESEFQAIAVEELQELFPQLLFLPEADALQQIEQSRFGKEIWPWLAALALLFLLAEMALAHTWARKGTFQVQKEPAPQL